MKAPASSVAMRGRAADRGVAPLRYASSRQAERLVVESSATRSIATRSDRGPRRSTTRCLMEVWIAGLLALLLAACSEPDSPAVDSSESAEATTQLVVGEADSAYYDELRARWLELEHAARVEAERALEPEPPPQRLPEPLPVEPATSPVPDSSAVTPAIAIIIDDVGHSLAQGRRLIALPAPVALAILPHTQAAQRLADEAGVAGKTVMLHQPMENGAGLSIGPGGLYVGMPRGELEQILHANLNSFVPIQGINNHMGSRLTAEREAMDWVMQVLKERGLFFIDSRTTRDTQAAFAAEAAGVRHLSRDVFLDNERTPEAIGSAFGRALALARRQGTALVIGHPYAQTLDYLEQRLADDLLRSEGVEVVSVEELLARKYRR